MDEVLHMQVVNGNLEGIKALRCAGAGLEWTNKEGKTPLIMACMKPESFQIVKYLVSLGANVNAYCPGSRAGTPLHHAAKNGLVHTVELLLSHGADPSVLNDDCQTALDLARAKGHWSVVRLFEIRSCRFNCWLREVHKPSILETITRERASRRIWAIILPCDACNPAQPKYDLTIYSNFQATKPKPVIPLSKVRIEEPAFDEPDPALIIVHKVTKKEYMFRSENEGDKQQLQMLYNICKEISQGNNYFPAAPAFTTMPNSLQPHHDIPATSAIIPQSTSEDEELAMAISASIQSALAEGINDVNLTSTRISTEPQLYESSAEASPVAQFPSAPPMVEETIYRGSIRYPTSAEANEGSSISCPIDLTVNASETKTSISEGASLSGLCVVCLDARVEGACIPCGHMAGCMSCLLEIKAKNWGCPVCRANIYQVVKLYAV